MTDTCFEIMKREIDDATLYFDGAFHENRMRLRTIAALSKIVDDILKRFDGTELSVEIDKETRDIFISFVCSNFGTNDQEDEIFDLFGNAKRIYFKPVEDELCVGIGLVYDGVWDCDDPNGLDSDD